MCMTTTKKKNKEKTMTTQQQKQLKIKTNRIPFVNIYLIKASDNLKIMRNSGSSPHYIGSEIRKKKKQIQLNRCLVFTWLYLFT